MATEVGRITIWILMGNGAAPLVTFALLAFNQERYIRAAVEAALAQRYSPLEVILSDDGSRDATADIIRDVVSRYEGKHHVTVNINERNLGIGAHVNKVFEIARGELVIMAAGDDVSLPERTARVVADWLAKSRRPSAIYCRASIIDADGTITGKLRTKLFKMRRVPVRLTSYRGRAQLLMGACAAYATDVYTHFGPLRRDLLVEDIPLTVRASLLGGVSCVQDRLVLYRANVSVWLPRKLDGESFVRHARRLQHFVRSDHLVSQQLLADAVESTSTGAIAAARRRYLATRFALCVVKSKRFALTKYISVGIRTRRWYRTVFPAALFAFPRLHHALFRVKQFAHELKR